MFKYLTHEQKETLKHLKEKGINTPLGVAEFCILKLSRSRTARNHSKNYYQGIVNYIAQGGTV